MLSPGQALQLAYVLLMVRRVRGCMPFIIFDVYIFVSLFDRVHTQVHVLLDLFFMEL